MIEIEKKFKLTDTQLNSLTSEAQFISEKTFTDTYYDTSDYALTTKDMWLRQRGTTFELKVALQFGYDRPADQYDEITDLKTIREKLHILADTDNFSADLATQGILPFVACQTTRRKYTNESFTIDMDLVTYADGSTYTLAEIECMIQDQSEVAQAIQDIHSFAESHGLKTEIIRGKIVEHLSHHRPEHLNALIKAGVIKA